MLTPLVYLQLGNVKKSKKLMKIADIVEENLHIFGTTCVKNTQDFALSLENTVLEL